MTAVTSLYGVHVVYDVDTREITRTTVNGAEVYMLRYVSGHWIHWNWYHPVGTRHQYRRGLLKFVDKDGKDVSL